MGRIEELAARYRSHIGAPWQRNLAGEPPFKGETTQAILAANLVQPPPRLDYIREDTPVPVCKAIEKALRKEPADPRNPLIV